MTRRPAAALVLGLALAAVSPAPVLAQRLPPPVLTLTPQTIDFSSALWGVSFGDADSGHAVGAYHSIFHTVDGGQTWARQANPLPTRPPPYLPTDTTDPTSGSFSAVSFVDAAHGFVVSIDGAVLTTQDRGTTWVQTPTPSPSTVEAAWPGNTVPTSWSFNGVSFADRDHGYVVGHDGVLLATSDRGRTWTYKGKPQYGVLRDVDVSGRLHGQVVGTRTGRPDQVEYTTLGTNDGGATWRQTLFARKDGTSNVDLSAVAVTDAEHAVAIGNNGRIVVTYDAGETWRNRRSGTNETLFDVAFADRERGLAVGGVNFQGDNRAIVLATNDGGESWTPSPQPDVGFLTSVSFASPTTAFAVGCVDTPACTAGVTKIDFPQFDEAVEALETDEGPRLPLLLLGAAALVLAFGVLAGWRPRRR